MKKNENWQIATLGFGGFLLIGVLFLCLTEGREFLGNRGYALRDDHFALLAVTIFGAAYGFIANKIHEDCSQIGPYAAKILIEKFALIAANLSRRDYDSKGALRVGSRHRLASLNGQKRS